MDFFKIAGVKQHVEFFKYLQDILFQKEEREKFYKKILEYYPDVSQDTFQTYFEKYLAERKSKQQDFTPKSIAKIVSNLTSGEKEAGWSAYDMTAGTGSLIIQKWWDDMTKETPFTYFPHKYLYRADELSDSALPFLLHNLAIRGMNCVVVHGDVLEREIKNIYFVQNSQDNHMGFSDINVMPRTKTVEEEFHVLSWLGEGINHIESERVIARLPNIF